MLVTILLFMAIGCVWGTWLLTMVVSARRIEAKELARQNDVEIARCRNYEVVRMNHDNMKAKAEIAKRDRVRIEAENERLRNDTAQKELENAKVKTAEAEANARRKEAERDKANAERVIATVELQKVEAARQKAEFESQTMREGRIKAEAEERTEKEKRQTVEFKLEHEKVVKERVALQRDTAVILDELCGELKNENTDAARRLLEKLQNRPYAEEMDRIQSAKKFFIELEHALRGDVKSQMEMVEQYENGSGFVVVSAEAAERWRKRLWQNHEAALKYAVERYNDNDHDTLIRTLRYLGSPKDYSAQENFLIDFLYRQSGSSDAGNKYLSAAAENEYIPAIMLMASNFYVQRKWKETYEWYSRAADEGEGDAEYYMAVMDGVRDYKYGRSYDPRTALKHMKNAARKGTTEGISTTQLVSYGMTYDEAKTYKVKRKPKNWEAVASEDMVKLGIKFH